MLFFDFNMNCDISSYVGIQPLKYDNIDLIYSVKSRKSTKL